MKMTREDAVRWWNEAKQRKAKRLADIEAVLQKRYEERTKQSANYALA